MTQRRCVDWKEVSVLRDGLYQVTTSYLCAGFLVENGKVTLCAPILRRRLEYWKTVAKEVRRG